MNAKNCYWCAIEINTIPRTVGDPDSPLGCCHKCNLFACGHHAQFDYGAKQYLCLWCDRSLIDKSARNIIRTQLEKLMGEKSMDEEMPDEKEDKSNYFNSWIEFKIRRLGYEPWFREIEELVQQNPDDRIPIDARLLLMAKMFIDTEVGFKNVGLNKRPGHDKHSRVIKEVFDNFINPATNFVVSASALVVIEESGLCDVLTGSLEGWKINEQLLESIEQVEQNLKRDEKRAGLGK